MEETSISRTARKQYTSQPKVAILREHLVEKVPTSEVCERHKVPPTVFYRWQQQLFENGAAVDGQVRTRPSSGVRISGPVPDVLPVPAAYWIHLRATNLIELVFATAHLRTNAAKRIKKT